MTTFTFKLTLASVLFAAAASAGAHGNAAHMAAMPAPMAAEQMDWGIAGDAKAATRTITLEMDDKMRFTPDRIEVRQGETVRLRVRNSGKTMHELVLGTPKELAAHSALMLKNPGMEHDEPYMAHVAPGKSGEIVWTFNRAGEFEFACLIAGHYQAGMKGTIRVAASGKSASSQPPQGMGHDMHHNMSQSMHGSMPSGMNMDGGRSGTGNASPYVGQQQREIKALSAEEIQAYAQGQGHGFAKAAELNGYPGPMHTLDLANELGLSEEQRGKTQSLLTQHKAEARRIGAELIEAERALNQAFASRSMDADSLARLTRVAGDKLTQLRIEHLQTHLAQTALLTPEQIERYKGLRGYGSGDGMRMDHQELNHGQHKH